MNIEEIIASNAIIDEYMGTRVAKRNYHTSWDWLMPVVSKIENETLLSIIISCDNCEVYNSETQETVYYEEGVKLFATWTAVTKAIEWIKKQPK